jgi:integrase
MTMKITDAWLRANSGRAYSGPQEITYKEGLGIRISPKGKISWIYRFRLKGKPTKMKIGDYPAMKIRDALDRKEGFLELVQQGVDPRNPLVIRVGKTAPTTVAGLIDHYVENQLREKNSQWRAIESNLNASIKPYVGDYDVNKLELSDFVELFNKERKRAGAKHSSRLLHRLKTVFNYGVRNGFLKYNKLLPLRVQDVGQPSEPRKTKLQDVQIGAFWICISSLPYHPAIHNLFRLNLIFGNRIGELILSTKSEFDFDKMVWTVPKTHNKIRNAGGNEIIRPIPSMAVSILREQFALFPEAKYTFPQYYVYNDLPINKKTPYRPSLVLSQMMEEFGYPEIRNHDMRRTARNAWEKLGFPFVVSETMLGHKVHKGVHAHYLDYSYLDEQRECYEKWCDYIKEMAEKFIDGENKVVKLKARA